MDVVNDFPTLINPGGEEVWCWEGSDLVFIRLKPGTKSDLYHHLRTKEQYTVFSGSVRFCSDGESFYVASGETIVFAPPQSHIVFNETAEPAILIARVNIPWNGGLVN